MTSEREDEAMRMSAGSGREYWCGVLAAGGATTVPRWTTGPVPGVGEHDEPLSVELVAALRRLARELAVPLGTVVLAAHAVVHGALSGEREVVTGYALPDGRVLPCRLPARAATWRELVRDTRRAEEELLQHRQFPVEDLRREPGRAGPTYESVIDLGGGAGGLPDGIVVRIAVAPRGDGLALRLQYRTDALDAAAAARIAGYHRSALAQLPAEPGAEPGRRTLLTADELRYQLTGLDGPDRELPDLRMHELFEQRVARHPDAVAAVHGGRRLTYRELNSRANRLARALLARSLPREAVVTVVLDRDLDWMASVLAIWKAGLAYLPLEPHFPAERMATAVSRSGSRLVLTAPGTSPTLEAAVAGLPGVEVLHVDAARAEGHADGDLGVDVDPDQLAYLLFTSGSTGEPKGAMCEHAGMLNHIQAKLADLGVGEGEVIPQTGPQCFDISVWQLVGALLVGGTTLLVEQDAVLDVARLVDTLEQERAGVLQVVPSYLDVLLSYLEQHPRELPDLHCVCPTGDFLKKELVRRWFAVQPGTRLVNTYGLTETSDDAVHEVLHAVPDGAQIPLGRPIQNTTVYVVDEHLSPVPLGAPGLIVFAGVCVGRGYVGDAERTALMFGADPHRPGRRICRTGDYGRWRPDGRLDFLGRRDDQVKIRGFRIEIGDVENALLQVPGVRDGAALVAGGAHLVAVYSGEGAIDAGALRRQLADRLPEYMLPSAFHWREQLPLTPNGKIDRSALTALAAQLQAAPAEHEAPCTPTEERVARAWAAVLGIPVEQVGRRDHFFDRGGSSLTAVKLVIALDRAVSLPDVTRHPTLADLAAVLDAADRRVATTA